MAEENKSSSGPSDAQLDACYKLLRANGQDKVGGGWTPVRYANMYIYIFFYNKISGNPRDFGLTLDSNDNTTIYNAIASNIDTLISKYGLGSLGHLFNKEKFLKDMSNLNEHALEFSSVFGKGRGEMINSSEANVVMQAKTKKCRKAFLAVKSSTDYKDYISKTGEENDKDADNGVYKREFYTAEKMYKTKKAQLRRARWKQLLFGGLAVGAAALTLTGLGALIGGGGALLGGLFGGVFSAGTFGGAIAGLAGTIGGGILSKTFFGKFLQRRAEKLKVKKDYLDFMRGEGKYDIKDLESGKVRGFRQLKKRLKYAMDARYIYLNYEGWKQKYEKKLRPDQLKVDYKDEYMRYIEKRYKKYCKAHPDYEEEIKEAIYNHEVGDTSGIMKKVLGLLQPQVAAEDKKNTMTVTERITFAEKLIEDSKNGIASLEDLKQQLLETEAYHDYFKSQNSEAAHTKLMNKLAKALVDKTREVAYLTFDDQTKKMIDDILEDEATQKAIKSAGIAGDIAELESLSTFIKKETRSFNTDLGVSLSEQVSFDKDSLKSGCQRIGIPDADRAAVDEAVTKIADMVSQSQHDSIEDYINSNISNKKVANYLRFMLERQTRQSTANTVGVDPSVKADIENLEDPDNVKAIKNKINALSGSAKVNAQAALQEQIKALNYKKQMQNVSGALVNIRELKDGDVKKNFETIDSIKYETVNEQELLVFKGSLAKIQNKQLSKYMQMKLNEKLEKTYLSYAEGKKNTFAGNIDDLKKFIIQVNESVILSGSQKSNIIGKVSDSLSTALQAEIETIPDNLFKSGMTLKSANDAASELVIKYKNYLERTISGGTITGFKEFFELGTTESDALKKRIESFQRTVGQIPQFLSASSFGGKQAETFDGTSSEAKKFLRAFYSKERDESDDLFKVSKKINGIYQEIEKVSSTAFIDPSKTDLTETLYKKEPGKAAEGILVDFKKTIDTIKTLDEDDKVAALVVLKKKCVGLFRAQMARNIRTSANDEEAKTQIADMIKNGKLFKQFENYYDVLFEAVDNELKDTGISTISSEINKDLGDPDRYLNLVKSSGERSMA